MWLAVILPMRLIGAQDLSVAEDEVEFLSEEWSLSREQLGVRLVLGNGVVAILFQEHRHVEIFDFCLPGLKIQIMTAELLWKGDAESFCIRGVFQGSCGISAGCHANIEDLHRLRIRQRRCECACSLLQFLSKTTHHVVEEVFGFLGG